MSKRRKTSDNAGQQSQEDEDLAEATAKRHAELKTCFISGLVKVEDCAQRIKDNLPDEDGSFKDLAYIAKQIAYLMAAASDMRTSLEQLAIAENYEVAKHMQRARLRDPAYTPDISEVTSAPPAVVEGFREG